MNRCDVKACENHLHELDLAAIERERQIETEIDDAEKEMMNAVMRG